MSGIRARVALLVSAAVLAAPVLAGCQSEPEPEFVEPSPSAPVTVSASPSESAAPVPTTPVQAVRAWVKARNQALQDGDTSTLRRLSEPGCASCSEHIEPIERVYASGGSFDTNGWRVSSAKVASERGDTAEVDVAMVMAGGRTIPERGADPVTYDEAKRIMLFRVTNSLIAFIGYRS